MNTEIFDHEVTHLMVESATDPIEPPGSALAALLLLAGSSPLRPRLANALPDSPLGSVQLPFLG
jgi:hypothetical protein